MKTALWKTFALLAIVSMLGAFLVVPAAAQEPSWWAKVAEPYKGVTIRGISESTEPSKYVASVLAKQFEEVTGVKVELELTSWDEMYNKGIKDMEAGTGVYDFVYVEQDIVFSYIQRNFLVNITQMRKDKPELAWDGWDPSKFVPFADYFKDANGDMYGVPIEAFIKTYFYRKDLFDDPEIKAAFEKEYGYPLAPATDHKQYTDIAKFFTKWGKDHNLELWGTTVQAVTGHSASFYEGFTEVPPQFGMDNWGINMDTWKCTVKNGGQMNSDTYKAALKWWLDLLEYAPPESTSSTWDEVAATFAAGRAAQALVYGENAAWIATDETRSKVVGKIAPALPPLEPGVLENAKAGKGSVGYFDGGAYGIPHSSKNKEAALIFMQYLAREDIQEGWAAAAARITMTSTYDTPKVKEMDVKTNGYYTLMREYGYLYAGAPPFAFHAPLSTVIMPYIWKAITGELTPEEALDQAAEASEAELVKLGYGK